jgi:hypothetical protein
MLGAIGAWSICHHAIAAPAASVEFAIGNATVINAAGDSRALSKGSDIEAGDTVDTGSGRVQLRFTDGAYISLQPGSRFRIDEYNYSGKRDDTERGFFSLIKGGLRTITGLIGRTNRRNYQVRVPVATIGIRGTEYTLLYDGTATGAVGEGEIAVCNSGGCLNVASGQAYTVADADTRPQLSTVRSFLAPPPPPKFVPVNSLLEPPNPADSQMPTSSVFSANDQVNQNGRPLSLRPANTDESGGPGTDQGAALATTAAAFLNRENTTDVRHTIAEVRGGRLVSWLDGPGTTNAGSTTIADRGNRGQIAWGRFINGQLGGNGTSAGLVLNNTDSFHYIVAQPTPGTVMQTAGHLTYTNVVGSTTPTTLTGLGQFVSASVDLDATLGRANASVSLVGPDKKGLTFNHEGVVNGALFSGTAGHGSGPACSASSCTGSFSGVIAGPQAQYAGFAYDIEGTSFGGVRGTAVLRR